jgi:hypothetical protein
VDLCILVIVHSDLPFHGGIWSVAQDTPLVFHSIYGNQISISDADAGSGTETVTLTAANGTLSLYTPYTYGLTFITGGGTYGTGGEFTGGVSTLQFTGTVESINVALQWMTFDPTSGFTGSTSIHMVTNDGALQDTDPDILISVHV